MKKKRFYFFAIILAIFIFSFSLLHAQIIGFNNSGSLPSSQDEAKQVTSDYLKQEWTKILEKNQFGQILLGISDFLKNFNPLFNIIFGFEYSLSWAFVFAVIVWLILFFFVLKPTQAILGNKWLGLLAAFLISSLVGVSGVIKQAVTFMAFVINNTWIAWISFFIALLILFLMAKFGKSLGKTIKKEQEKNKKRKLEEDREVIHAEAEVAKKQLKSYSEKDKKR